MAKKSAPKSSWSRDAANICEVENYDEWLNYRLENLRLTDRKKRQVIAREERDLYSGQAVTDKGEESRQRNHYESTSTASDVDRPARKGTGKRVTVGEKKTQQLLSKSERSSSASFYNTTSKEKYGESTAIKSRRSFEIRFTSELSHEGYTKPVSVLSSRTKLRREDKEKQIGYKQTQKPSEVKSYGLTRKEVPTLSSSKQPSDNSFGVQKMASSSPRPSLSTLQDKKKIIRRADTARSTARNGLAHSSEKHTVLQSRPLPIRNETASSAGQVQSVGKKQIKQSFHSKRYELPINEYRDDIMHHIVGNRVTCIQGETGCGKSTMVPQFVLEHYTSLHRSVQYLHPQLQRAYKPNIIVTQPRRLAAKKLAERVASDLEEHVGQTVGYKIGADKNTSSQTRLTYCTTGYLLQLLVNSPKSFGSFTHIILDEIHERQLDSDLLSLVVKLCMSEHSETKIIVMSATLQGNLFSRYFQTHDYVNLTPIAKPIFVGAKHFTVHQEYLESLVRLRQLQGAEVRNIVEAIKKFKFGGRGRFANDSKPPPDIMAGLLQVGKKLILSVMRPGEAILIFLPGIGEIQELYDMLEPIERKPESETCKLRLFVLHSTIPMDEQEAAFREPPFDTAHIILSTNIAESSLTLPKIRVVIDYGLRRQLVYDPKRQMNCLVNTWISQASAQQREGRAGRVFEGVVYRMYTQLFYDQLDEFDEAEMKSSPLEKLVLRVKHLGRNIAPDETVRELLSQAVQPPSLSQLNDAIQHLFDIGALTGNSEDADMTLLGHVAISLPVDLLKCRLVLYGALFNCVCDAIVMAAAMSLRQDPFSLPTIMIMKDPKVFLPSLERSFAARVKFDEGLYSEPIMMRNVFMAWLKTVRNSGNQDTSITQNADKDETHERDHGDQRVFCHRASRMKTRVSKLRKDFCHQNALHVKRFQEFENTVADVASRVVTLLPAESRAYSKVSSLMKILHTDEEDEAFNSEEVHNESGNQSQSEVRQSGRRSHSTSVIRSRSVRLPENTTETALRPVEIFNQNFLVLHAALVAAFSPAFVRGTCFDEKKAKGTCMVNKCERNATAIQNMGLDAKKSVILNNILKGNSMLRGNIDLIESIVSLTCKPLKIEIDNRTFDRVFVEFEKDRRLPQDTSIVADIPFPAHILHQFGEARNSFAVPLKNGTQAQQACQRDQLSFDKPVQPYRLHWTYSSQVKGSTEPHLMEANCYGFRNPVGFVCDTRVGNHYAVASAVQGLNNPKLCHIHGVTILSPENDGMIAKALMVALTSQNYKLHFIVGCQTPRCIVGVNICGLLITFTKRRPLSCNLLQCMNELRAEISRAFRLQHVGRVKIHGSGVETKLLELVAAIKEQGTRDQRLAGAKHQEDRLCGIHFEPFSRSALTGTVLKASEFHILQPFDLPTIKRHLDEIPSKQLNERPTLASKLLGLLGN